MHLCCLWITSDTFGREMTGETPEQVTITWSLKKHMFTVITCFVYCQGQLKDSLPAFGYHSSFKVLTVEYECSIHKWPTTSAQYFTTYLNSLLSSILWIGSCSAKFLWGNFWLWSKSLVLITCFAPHCSAQFTDEAGRTLQEAGGDSGVLSLISPFAMLLNSLSYQASTICFSCFYFF